MTAFFSRLYASALTWWLGLDSAYEVEDGSDD